MSKSIDNLTLGELIELKSATDLISEEYAKDLTTYATINGDAYFKYLNASDQIKYEKRQNLIRLSNKLKCKIENIVEQYYD